MHFYFLLLCLAFDPLGTVEKKLKEMCANSRSVIYILALIIFLQKNNSLNLGLLLHHLYYKSNNMYMEDCENQMKFKLPIV